MMEPSSDLQGNCRESDHASQSEKHWGKGEREKKLWRLHIVDFMRL